MLLLASAEEADGRAQPIDVLGETYVLRGYVGAAPVRGTYVDGNEDNDNGLPQGFLVSQPPASTTHPHFHETDQFQVFVGGHGRFGKKPIEPLTVQYASGHTPYGPIVAGEDGLRYFTLRKRWDPGAKYMPRMRERLVRGRQRQRLVPHVPLGPAAQLAVRERPLTESLFGPEPDGLLAAILRLGPGQRASTPDPGEGEGQFHVVVSGSLVHEGRFLGPLSCQFADREEGPVGIEAGPEGLEMLVLRFAANPASGIPIR
jgi:hypothetical protein